MSSSPGKAIWATCESQRAWIGTARELCKGAITADCAAEEASCAPEAGDNDVAEQEIFQAHCHCRASQSPIHLRTRPIACSGTSRRDSDTCRIHEENGLGDSNVM